MNFISNCLKLTTAAAIAASLLGMTSCRGTEAEEDISIGSLLVLVVNAGGEPLSADTVFWWHPIRSGSGGGEGPPETFPGLRIDSAGTRWMLQPDNGEIVVRTVHYQQTDTTSCMSSGNSMDTVQVESSDTLVVTLSPIVVCVG